MTNVKQAPKVIGPYSLAVSAGNFLFVSGQIAIDPESGKILAESIEAQTEQVLDNIAAILASAGLTWDDAVKTEIYLMDLQDFATVNGIYAKRFMNGRFPARQTLQVAGLPLDARIEISCIAYIDPSCGCC